LDAANPEAINTPVNYSYFSAPTSNLQPLPVKDHEKFEKILKCLENSENFIGYREYSE
jgi:hypothetical protein